MRWQNQTQEFPRQRWSPVVRETGKSGSLRKVQIRLDALGVGAGESHLSTLVDGKRKQRECGFGCRMEGPNESRRYANPLRPTSRRVLHSRESIFSWLRENAPAVGHSVQNARFIAAARRYACARARNWLGCVHTSGSYVGYRDMLDVLTVPLVSKFVGEFDVIFYRKFYRRPSFNYNFLTCNVMHLDNYGEQGYVNIS